MTANYIKSVASEYRGSSLDSINGRVKGWSKGEYGIKYRFCGKLEGTFFHGSDPMRAIGSILAHNGIDIHRNLKIQKFQETEFGIDFKIDISPVRVAKEIITKCNEKGLACGLAREIILEHKKIAGEKSLTSGSFAVPSIRLSIRSTTESPSSSTHSYNELAGIRQQLKFKKC